MLRRKRDRTDQPGFRQATALIRVSWRGFIEGYAALGTKIFFKRKRRESLRRTICCCSRSRSISTLLHLTMVLYPNTQWNSWALRAAQILANSSPLFRTQQISAGTSR
jgi:hypothetical protein